MRATNLTSLEKVLVTKYSCQTSQNLVKSFQRRFFNEFAKLYDFQSSVEKAVGMYQANLNKI